MKSLLLVTTLLLAITSASAETLMEQILLPVNVKNSNHIMQIQSKLDENFRKAKREGSSIIHLIDPIHMQDNEYASSYIVMPKHNIDGKKIECIANPKTNISFNKIALTRKADGLTTFDILDSKSNSAGNLSCKSDDNAAVITTVNIQKYLFLVANAQALSTSRFKSFSATTQSKSASNISISDFTNHDYELWKKSLPVVKQQTKISNEEALRIRLDAERTFYSQK